MLKGQIGLKFNCTKLLKLWKRMDVLKSLTSTSQVTLKYDLCGLSFGCLWQKHLLVLFLWDWDLCGLCAETWNTFRVNFHVCLQSFPKFVNRKQIEGICDLRMANRYDHPEIHDRHVTKNKGASPCHRRTFLSKWFHKEPLTSEEPFCFTKGSLWRKNAL